MSRFLSGYLRQIGWSFAAAVLLGGVLLLVMGETARIGALLAGAALLRQGACRCSSASC